VEKGTYVIELEPTGPKVALTAEEQECMRPMFRYSVSDSAELTEREISEMEATETEKAVSRFLAKNKPERRIIEIGTFGKNAILLHGAAEVETFIALIRQQSREAFSKANPQKERTVKA